jgi:hypothetical protein
VNFAGDLSAFYADFGESVTVAGSSISAIFDSGYGEAAGIVAGTVPRLRCRASDVSGVAIGAAVVRAGTNYTVRGREAVPPDELETVLVLERA